MKIFSIGASRNIGYYSALTLLQQGHQVVFLLRKADVFEDDADMKLFVDSGSAKLVQGDALVESDVGRAWSTATSDGPVDVVIFSVGALPSFSVAKFGFVLPAPSICTTALLNTFSTIPNTAAPSSQPRFVIISALGVTKDSQPDVPYAMRPINALIKAPHADKLGMERITHYSAGWTPEWKDRGPSEDVLAPGWEAKLPGKGWLKHAVIIRPAILTDGPAGEKYRVGEHVKGLYTISRKDVAHFIVSDLLENWEKYDGKAISIGN